MLHHVELALLLLLLVAAMRGAWRVPFGMERPITTLAIALVTTSLYLAAQRNPWRRFASVTTGIAGSACTLSTVLTGPPHGSDALVGVVSLALVVLASSRRNASTAPRTRSPRSSAHLDR